MFRPSTLQAIMLLGRKYQGNCSLRENTKMTIWAACYFSTMYNTNRCKRLSLYIVNNGVNCTKQFCLSLGLTRRAYHHENYFLNIHVDDRSSVLEASVKISSFFFFLSVPYIDVMTRLSQTNGLQASTFSESNHAISDTRWSMWCPYTVYVWEKKMWYLWW